MVEDEDPEAMRQELREAFRLYDREGNGYITTDTLKEIFKELDNTIDEDDLDDMIDEIDEDGSGTVDFEEFFGVMTGADWIKYTHSFFVRITMFEQLKTPGPQFYTIRLIEKKSDDKRQWIVLSSIELGFGCFKI